jgi:hypothetical protein
MIATSWLYRILGATLAAAALLWLIQSRDHWRDEAKANATLYRQAQAASAVTVANYRAAADQARREDAANVARAEAEQAAISERTTNDFESRIASARALADRLRKQAAGAAADPGAGRAAPMPGLPAGAAAVAEAAGEDRLPQSDRLIATEQAIQLDELIKWVRRQAAIPQDGGPGARQAAIPQDGGPGARQAAK